MMSDILTESTDGIMRIEMNRPDKKNALTATMYTEIAELIDSAAKDPGVHVVLWHGAGGSFSAGNDLADFLLHPPGPDQSPQADLLAALMHIEKPIVAAVSGFAIGAGTTMLTHCDFVYAGEGTKFQLPFINLALVPEFGTSFSLAAQIGYTRAAELVYLGEFFSAAYAYEAGLVTKVVADDAVLATAVATAKKLAVKPAGALQACKKLMKQAMLDPMRMAAKAEGVEFSGRLHSEDTLEAIAAFKEKRMPHFVDQ